MSDFSSLFQAVVALLFVLSLILLGAAGAKRFIPGNLMTGKAKRLQLIESLPLDARHRAVLLRCDGREHLLALGGDGGVTLIERNLQPGGDAPPAADTPAHQEPLP